MKSAAKALRVALRIVGRQDTSLSMKMISAPLVFLALSLLANSQAATPPLSARIEGAASTTGYNYFRIPSEGANTRYDLPVGAWLPTYRIYAHVPVSENWALRFLYAPLVVNYSYQSSTATVFQNTTFAANANLTAGYKFNSYRASIIRYFNPDPAFQWHVGFTAKIRDAYISVSDGAVSQRKDDLGFVPLLNLGLDWRPFERWTVSADLDGLAGGPGRAFDGRVEFRYSPISQLDVGVGYRFVEGGANVAAVNNFALFHSVFLSVTGNWGAAETK